ncbi:MFS transporter [Candidatus Falkowbacteria bacterium]|nr:MFS transporter [Candidatus Falkowbacteria bacterium]
MTKRTTWFNIIALGLVSFLTDLGSEVIYPILPFFFTSLGVSVSLIGLIEGLAESTASLTKLHFGLFSDKIKKRKVFALAGYTLSSIGKALLPLAAGPVLLFGGRFLDRFGKGIRTAPRDALLAESAQEGKTGAAFGLHRSLDTLGAVGGVLMAWFLLKNNVELRNIFFIALIPSFLGIFALWLVKENKKELSDKPARKLRFAWNELPTQLKVFFAASAIFALGNSSNIFLILKAMNIGFAASGAILLYLAYNASHAILSYPAGIWSDKIGRKNVLLIGYLLYGLIYLVFAFTKSPTIYPFLFIIYGFYGGLTEGVEKALVADNSNPEQKATFQGMHALIVGTLLLPASLLAGWLWQHVSPSAPFYLSSLTSFIAIIILAKNME